MGLFFFSKLKSRLRDALILFDYFDYLDDLEFCDNRDFHDYLDYLELIVSLVSLLFLDLLNIWKNGKLLTHLQTEKRDASASKKSELPQPFETLGLGRTAGKA